MGRAFGDFSISKNEEHAFSRAHVIPALKSYRAHIKKRTQGCIWLKASNYSHFRNPFSKRGVRTSNSNRVALLKRLHQCLLKTHTKTHTLSGACFSPVSAWLHCTKDEPGTWRDGKTQRLNLARPQPSGEGECLTARGILTFAPRERQRKRSAASVITRQPECHNTVH